MDMGLVLFPGTFPNNCDVLSSLPHKSHALVSSPLSASACVHESNCSLHDRIECIYLCTYIENNVTGFLYVALEVVLVLTLCGVLLLSMCYSTTVCNQQHQDHLCSTQQHFTFFSFDYLYMCIKLQYSIQSCVLVLCLTVLLIFTPQNCALLSALPLSR